MKKALKITGIVLLAVIFIAAAAFGVYWYNNTHWFEKNKKALNKAGAIEKQYTLQNGRVINYGEVDNDKPALLLIHAQFGMWEDYASVIPKLSESWHIYAVDVYGHGESSHDESLYYLDVNGDDLITFINEVIAEPTVVAGHSNGAITAAYVAAYGGDNIAGAVLEDPPIFSTAGEGWDNSFAYIDTYKPLHEYNLSDKTECWEAYYLRHCYWGKQYVGESGMNYIADSAQKYRDEHPDAPIRIGLLKSEMLEYCYKYDTAYGEKFYDLSWTGGFTHEQILERIKVPCVYIHAKEYKDKNGICQCASTNEQAERAVSIIGDNCRLVETDDSRHEIHTLHSQVYIDAVNSLKQE